MSLCCSLLVFTSYFSFSCHWDKSRSQSWCCPLVGFSSEAQSWVSVLVLVLGPGSWVLGCWCFLMFLQGHAPSSAQSYQNRRVTFSVSFFSSAFLTPFCAPGQAERSIVTNLVPKMTPKWRSKVSPGTKRRQVRTSRKHCLA